MTFRHKNILLNLILLTLKLIIVCNLSKYRVPHHRCPYVVSDNLLLTPEHRTYNNN